MILLDAHVGIAETDNLFLPALASLHDKFLPALDFTAWHVAFHLGFICHYFLRLTGLTRFGLPAGCPSFFFSDIFFFFCAEVSSPAVTGVLELTRFDGLQ